MGAELATHRGTTQPSTASLGMTQPSTAYLGTTRPGTAYLGTTHPGTAYIGMTRPGTTYMYGTGIMICYACLAVGGCYCYSYYLLLLWYS